MKDYAAELAERWFKKIDETTNMSGAIEGAIREALAKAAEVAPLHDGKGTCHCGNCSASVKRIRALGAKR